MARVNRVGGDVWRLFLPAPLSLVPLVLAALWVLLTGGALLAIGDSSAVALTVGLAVAPIAAMLAFLSAILAKNASSRAAIFALTAVILGVGALSTALHDAGKGVDPGLVFVSIFLYSIPVVVTGTLAIFFGMRASKEVVERIQQSRADRLCQLLLERGEASFQELSAESGVPETEVDAVIEDRVRAGQLGAVLDPAAHMVFTDAQFQAKEGQLVAVTHARGRAAIYDVAQELRLSEERFRELLYAALAHRCFAGYVDWNRGIVFSADARRLREGRQCPSCGGSLDLAGYGVLACPHCRAEILLA